MFFDMGGTIETFQHTPELRRRATPGLVQRLVAAGIDLHLDTEQLYQLVVTGLDRYHQWSLQTLEELSPGRVWRDFILRDHPASPERLEAVAEDLMLYLETRYYQRVMRPEAPAVLKSIRDMGLRIGLISNVCSRGQVPYCLERYGLRDFFDPIVLSSEYGRRKPDPSIFHYAARLANIPTSACAYIGDRVARDIKGARAAGFRLAVQIRHDFQQGEGDNGVVPDAMVEDLLELVDLLRAAPASGVVRGGSELDPRLKIRAVLFDAGDILYCRPHKGARLTEFLETHGRNPGDVPREAVRALTEEAYRGELGQEQYRRSVLSLHGVTDPEEVAQGLRVLEEDDNAVRLTEGVPSTLAGLKARGYMLGIVTDTALPVHVKLAWFARGGFGDVWDSIVSSRELGIQKPDPRIYQAALCQLGLSAGEAAFVGHAQSELAGAREVGMYTIAFNYEPGACADDYVDRFQDLLNSKLLKLEANPRAAP